VRDGGRIGRSVRTRICGKSKLVQHDEAELKARLLTFDIVLDCHIPYAFLKSASSLIFFDFLPFPPFQSIPSSENSQP